MAIEPRAETTGTRVQASPLPDFPPKQVLARRVELVCGTPMVNESEKQKPRASLTIKSRAKADGSVSWFLWIRPTPPDGKSLIPVPNATKATDRAIAEAFAAPYRKALKKGLSAPQPETCTEYFERFAKHRSAIGKVRRIRDLESAWNTWIAPKLGTRPIATITRDHVEDVRDALDAEVAKRKKEGGPAGLSGARARNVWSVLSSMMEEACTSKKRDLRVRADNPCSTVQPPDKTDARAKTFIYPSEFLTLTACDEIPRDWREAYAVACYLYLRPGELRALVWSDVDFQAGVVHVTKAYDEDSQTVKAPKTRKGVRDVPIPAALVPLLKAMHERTPAPKGAVSVLPLMEQISERRRAGHMRKHFTLAKIDRSRLTEQSATTMQINFRSWRDTGITWLALDGVDLAKIQRRAGHERIETSAGYVKAAEDLTGSIGQPFPTLPAELVGDAEVPQPEESEPTARHSVPCEPEVTCEPSDPLSVENLELLQDSIAERAGFESAPNACILDGSAIGCEPHMQRRRSIDDEDVKVHTPRPDPDEALRQAIKVALDVGDYERVRALLTVLEASSPPTGRTIDLTAERAKRR